MVERLADVMVERALLLLSFLLFLLTVDSGRGEPTTDPVTVLGTVPFPWR